MNRGRHPSRPRHEGFWLLAIAAACLLSIFGVALVETVAQAVLMLGAGSAAVLVVLALVCPGLLRHGR